MQRDLECIREELGDHALHGDHGEGASQANNEDLPEIEDKDYTD